MGVELPTTPAPALARRIHVLGRLRVRHWISAIVLLALIVRISVIVATPHYLAVTDAGEFDADAVTLVQHHRYPSSGLTAGGGPTAFRPPLFPLSLAALYKVVGVGSAKTRWAAGRVMEAVFGAAVVLLICLIGVRLFGRTAGLVAGGIAAVYPPLVLVGSSLLSESLFIPLELGSVWAALVHRDSEHRYRWAVLSGVLVGLAELTRSNGFALALPIGFLVWSQRPSRTPRAHDSVIDVRAVRAPAAFLAAFVLTLVPWTVRDYHVFHQFVPITTEAGYGLAGAYNPAVQARTDYPALWQFPTEDVHNVWARYPKANEAEVSAHLTDVALDYIAAHPSSVLKTAYWNVLRLLNLTGPGIERGFAGGEGYSPTLAQDSVYAFWVVLALAIAGAFTRAARLAPKALWGCPIVVMLTTVVLLGLTRYRSPADPFFVLLAALGLSSLASRARTAINQRRAVSG
jgi:4-amino-4-deoxy-L-arabinose transferase-like glycosyltransferase